MSYIYKANLKTNYTDEFDYGFVEFCFNIQEVQGYYISKEHFICVVISGQIYELEYEKKLYILIKKYFTPISLN